MRETLPLLPGCQRRPRPAPPAHPLPDPGLGPMIGDMDDSALDLTGRILMAMPSMGDPRFQRSVVCMVRHDRDGALGLIINKPRTDLRFSRC